MELFYLCIYIVVIVILIKFIKHNFPIWIGRSGEKFVANKLLSLDPIHYKIINDLYIPSNGRTSYTQIDHVVISNYGIFCLETKDYDGWIFGDAYDKSWTQVIYRSKHRFYNPLRQNYAHSKALEALVKPICPNAKIFSYVVFPSARRVEVTSTKEVGDTAMILDDIDRTKVIILLDAERDKIYELLNKMNMSSDKNLIRMHIQEVQELKNGITQ